MITSSVMKRAMRNAFSSSGVRLTSTRLAPRSAAASLIWGEAVGGGRIDAGDEPQVEQQEAALAPLREQRLTRS